MPTAALPPDDHRRLADLESRIAILERKLGSTGAAAVDELVFSFPGALTVIESPEKFLAASCVLTTLAVVMKPAGSTSTSIAIKRNGATKATVTVPASTTKIVLQVAVAFTAGDVVSLEPTSVGTGAANMTATARFVA